MYLQKAKDKNIAQQVALIRIKYNQFTVMSTHTALKATGELQPTARSIKYEVEIKYQLRNSPVIKILKPQLITNFKNYPIPHVYPGNKLCLYMPRFREFTYADYLTETIFPWTSLWLYYYEVWHATGEWLGGGEHPTAKKTKK
jgi:hypothetical protein